MQHRLQGRRGPFRGELTLPAERRHGDAEALAGGDVLRQPLQGHLGIEVRGFEVSSASLATAVTSLRPRSVTKVRV